MAGVLIVAECTSGQPSPSTLELAAVGRRLADELGQPLSAVLAGKNVTGCDTALGSAGIDLVLIAEESGTGPVSLEWTTGAVLTAIERTQAEIVLVTHAAGRRELGASLAYRLNTGVVTDCTKLRLEEGRVVATKPVFGGSALTDQVITGTPQVLTLRPRSFDPAEAPAGRQAQVETLAVPTPDSPAVQVIEEIREETAAGPRLKDAKVVVAGGRGLGGPENWHYVEELAQVLGGAVGATRAVTDAGWISPSFQVGLTGASIAPDLYVTVGISGAVQHVAGISGAKNVVAINKDPEANIFKVARYGAVGDWKQILPAFIARLKELRG